MIVKIGNAQGFWGDRTGTAAKLLSQQSDLNYITMDYLAEVSLSLLAIQKERAPHLGYARDFVGEVESLNPFWEKGSQVKVVANAGGLNPIACAEAVASVLTVPKKIGIVMGDDVLSFLLNGEGFSNLDTGEPITHYQERLVSANVYLGAHSIVDALREGADIVITGRVADPSLVTACCVAHFNWNFDDYDKLAQATVAGHLIECGTQVTGGISTNWLEVSNPESMGFPVIEMSENSEFVITKPDQTGGCVNEQTVKEQLLYEIGDPGQYLSPDVEVSFLSITIDDEGNNRVKVVGAKGKPPPSTFKVSATYRDGYQAEAMLTLFGREVENKAKRCSQIVFDRVEDAGYVLENVNVECIGAGDVVPGVVERTPEPVLKECVMRLCVRDSRKEAVHCFSKAVAPLVTSGAQGTTGYFKARPKPQPVFGFWPCLISSEHVHSNYEIVEVS